jgi:hypothetical protein
MARPLRPPRSSTRRSGGGSATAVTSAGVLARPCSTDSTRRSDGGSCGMSCHGGRTRPSAGGLLTAAGAGGAAASSLLFISGQLAREPGSGVSARWAGIGSE